MCPSSTTSSNPPKPHVDGLVTIHDGRRVSSGIKWVVIVLFLTVIMGTGLIDSIFPVPLPRLTGLERGIEERRIRNARIVDGSKARLIEHRQRLHSRIRALVSPEYSFALHRWLHEVKSSVIYGKDGWLFLKNRVIPKQQVPHATLTRIADNISHISQECTLAGSRLVLLPIPRKAVLCAEYLPDWVRPDLSIDSVFISLLQKRDICTVDMMELVRNGGYVPPYYKRGSHWTHATQLTVAEAVCEAAGIISRAEERVTEIVPLGRQPEEFGVLGYAGITTNRRIEEFLKTTSSPKYKVRGKAHLPIIPQKDRDEQSVYLFGTSFSAGSFSKFMQHFSRFPITNMAHRGTNPFQDFGAFLGDIRSSSAASVLPDITIIEFPIHQLFEPLQKEFVTLRILLQSEEFDPRTDADVVIAPMFAMGHDISHTPVAIATLTDIPRHDFSDGAMGILLSGELRGGNATLIARSRHGTSRVHWKQGMETQFIPVTGGAAVDHITVFIRSSRDQYEPVHARIDAVLWSQSIRTTPLHEPAEPTGSETDQNISRN